ncbi:hypothetical protein PLEOSDRAFT_1108226 [Pleurotus ostreatus PC15]|uniref:Uncharacterized protein n=1 Tax=Pleurotus ostreatus (strain PC15) TaxID=1137138 RepID=A0A067N9V7_PLEO1|nr:hypothetical protein PLEOSDRAFT_1108226 [Pleurotus ostreatus PC15]
MSSRSVIIDNADAQVQYSPGWQANGSPNEYKRTTSNTETQGASFTLKFVGTSVAVYGTLDTVSLPNTTYVLDGGNPFPFFGQPQPQIQYQQVFYTSPSLPYAEHTLVGSCANAGGRVILDYFVVEIPLEIPTNTSMPTTTSTVPTTLDSKPTPPTTAIVGGVLGGLLLLMTILASYLWYRQSRGNGRSTDTKPSFMNAEPDAQLRPLNAPAMASSSYITTQHETPYHNSEASHQNDVISTIERHKSPHVSDMSTRTLIVDDEDTQIQYSPGWRPTGSPNEYKRTTSFTSTQGASFTLNFTGTSVTVYGTLDVTTFPNTTYVLDGGDPFPFFGIPKSAIQYQQVFYASPPLPYRGHTLVGSCADEGGRVILDYFVVEIPQGVPPSPSSPCSQSLPCVTNSKPTIITGAVLGGLLLVMTTLALYLWHQQTRGVRTKLPSATELNTQIHPFEASDMPSSSSNTLHNVSVSVESHKSPLPQWHRLPPSQPPSYTT